MIERFKKCLSKQKQIEVSINNLVIKLICFKEKVDHLIVIINKKEVHIGQKDLYKKDMKNQLEKVKKKLIQIKQI